ncbi:MAG TPA: BON domain-containing protein [Candidatus Elarobacter sp.]
MSPARSVAAAAVLAGAVALIAGCTGSSEQKTPEPFGTRAATAVLKDALTLSAVKAKLVGDDPDSTLTLRVAVNDGVVTLRGTVHDAAIRHKVVADARATGGVKRVVDELRVDPHGPRLRQQVGDVALAARIEAAITAQVGLQHVVVHVDRGVATLDGSVPDAKTKRTVLATARGTAGVRNVVDRVRVGGT